MRPVSADEPTDHARILEGTCPKHRAPGPGRQDRFHRRLGPKSATDFARHVGAQGIDDLCDHSRMPTTTAPSSVEIDDVQPARTGRRERRRALERIVAVDVHPLEVALSQPNNPTANEIDCGEHIEP